MISTYKSRFCFDNVIRYFTIYTHKCGVQNVMPIGKKLQHTPVMVNEVVHYLEPAKESVFVDMTFGAGGHTKTLLNTSTKIKLFCLDRDPVAYKFAKELAEEYPNQVFPLLGRFSELPSLLQKQGIKQNSVDGILFDFGCSSMQFDVAERGFSVSKDGPLDMRMDGERFPDNPTAADVLAKAEEEDLVKIFKVYGEEKQAKKVARAIVEARYAFKPLKTTKELADFVAGVCSQNYRLDQLQRSAHIATKIFQALRIFVNNEMNEINYGMTIAHRYLKVGGRIVTLSFHSLEDTIVKRHIDGHVINNVANRVPLKYCNYSLCESGEEIQKVMSSNWKALNKHVVTPTIEEIESNPRSRSAKLRAAVKIK